MKKSRTVWLFAAEVDGGTYGVCRWDRRTAARRCAGSYLGLMRL
jgi:hypothetical protein